jgi:endonuclease III related protein
MRVKKADQILKIYKYLFSLYGPQGWWPIIDSEGADAMKKDSIRGYHPYNYELPETPKQIYEIILGSILTQNTSWLLAERALINLFKLNAINPQKLLRLEEDVLKDAIKSAGFLNQKSIYLKEITKFFISLENKIPLRKELLEVKGVGNETADSILLYAYKRLEFVIDNYTKRFFAYLGLIDENNSYNKIKKLFESSLPADIIIYQEYHALIVEHAKRYYKKNPYGNNDPLKKIINLF